MISPPFKVYRQTKRTSQTTTSGACSFLKLPVLILGAIKSLLQKPSKF
jgi:hypothetical protein